jgi:predicted phage tail protein
MRTTAFWVDAAERAVRTFAQALVAMLVVGFVFTDAAAWGEALVASAVAALISLLTSVAASGVGDQSTPSLLPVAPVEQPDPNDDY